MNIYIERKENSHLKEQDRIDIASCLSRNLRLVEIAHYIHCDERTISKEIRKHIRIEETKCSNNCIYKRMCHTRFLCGEKCDKECRNCKKYDCNNMCTRYDSVPKCKRLQRFPYVCNACPTRHVCQLNKYIYDPKIAQKEYENTLVESRNHMQYSLEEIKQIDKLIAPLIKNNISPEIALFDIKDELLSRNIKLSIPTLYKLIANNKLSIKNIDLKRAVRYASRKKKPAKIKADPTIKINRYYEDFLNYITEHPNLNVWEMDTVEGIKSGKALMTLLFRKTNLMFIFLIDRICKEEIIRVFNFIKLSIGDELFKNTFNIILTDNGKEFFDPDAIEASYDTGKKIIRLFYCEPRQSQQKGKIEKNHEHIREIIPKGKEMNFLSNDLVSLMSNHINNYPRPSLNMCSPLKASKLFLDEAIFKLNHLSHLKINDINLTPSLLK